MDALKLAALPPFVPPVKLIILTSWCSIRGAPVVGPKPVTTLIKPSGRSASSKIFINSNVEHDALSEGLITTVLPAAIAGANFQINVPIGEFQGRMSATTPNGSHFK